MLEKLFGSKTRVKLLELFLLHPEEKHYIRQIARETGLQLNSVRRELGSLEKLGLLKSETIKELDAFALEIAKNSLDQKSETPESKPLNPAKARQTKKYFQLNENFPLLEEIKSLVARSPILYKADFIKELKTAGEIKILILTGIFTNEQKSPVDLLIVGRIHKEKLAKIIKGFEAKISREINYTQMSFKEFEDRRNLTDVFIYSILEGKKIVVIDEKGVV